MTAIEKSAARALSAGQLRHNPLTTSGADIIGALAAAFYKEVRMSPGLTGGTVMHGHKTSKMPKPVFSEYLSFINAMAADLGVELSE